MTSLATPFGNLRHDAMRWGICFALAIAAHGAAAWALLLNPSSDSDFDAGAPVVMIELPEAPTAFATPPSDLTPGPTEPESERTPPPKEETKPPEEVAGAAQAATADRGEAADRDALDRYDASAYSTRGRCGCAACGSRRPPLGKRARCPSRALQALPGRSARPRTTGLGQGGLHTRPCRTGARESDTPNLWIAGTRPRIPCDADSRPTYAEATEPSANQRAILRGADPIQHPMKSAIGFDPISQMNTAKTRPVTNRW